MGLIRGYFSLSNPTRPDLEPLEVSALADSRDVHLSIPEHLAIQLSLAQLERREVVLADGHRRTVPYAGPVEVRFRNRRCFTGAMVLGNGVLLGAIPMQDMDLVCSSRQNHALLRRATRISSCNGKTGPANAIPRFSALRSFSSRVS
jgi:clan AA aspartic protease